MSSSPSQALLAHSEDDGSEAGQVQRTSCGVELCLELDVDGRPVLFVRGWVFDRFVRALNLKLSTASGAVRSVVYPIDRSGGMRPLSRTRHALEGSFTALLYLDTLGANLSSLQFSYELPRGGVVQGEMKLPEPRCAVGRASSSDDSGPHARLDSDLVVVTPLHTTPEPALLHALMREIAMLDLSTTCICSPISEGHVMTAMSPYQVKGPPVRVQSYTGLAKLLRRERAAYKVVVFAHRWESSLEDTVIPTLLASSRTPGMILLHPGESLVMPATFGGGLLDVVRWPSADFSTQLRSRLLSINIDT